MIVNRIVLCTVLLAVIFSCKKEEVKEKPMNPTQGTGIMVEGIVRDSLTGNPLSGVLLGTYSSDGYENFNYLTGSDGYYRQYINWYWSKPGYFTAQLADPLYYNATPPVSLFNYEYGDTLYQDVERIPYSKINVHLNCTGNSFYITDLGKPPSASWQSVIQLLPNGHIDTTIVRYMKAYQQRDLVFYVGGSMYSDTVIQTGYGTVHTIEINYP